MKFTIVFLSLVLWLGCANQKGGESPLVTSSVEKDDTVEKKPKLTKTPDPKGDVGRKITAEVVSKPFMKKNNQPTSQMEYYVRRSIQDYFIKFCESAVSREEVEKAIADSGSTLSLEIEIKTGEWDKCGTEEVQSRVGDYIVIHAIL